MIDHRETPGCTTVLLTPALARQWLHDGACCLCDEAKLDAYAQAMLAGDRQPGSLFSFYANGAMRDGTHRARAVVKSGVTIEVAVWTCDWLG